ncbi:MAG: helix-turn-helix transcriptional regulator [Gammaproteobacteria bacterium]|nr:helix-turn-helix transcriptional regulator [Gammaproteobacteria bacterium]
MAGYARFAEIAALAGDPARASMLHALMDGRALTAGELAHVAGITPQTASGHLAQMVSSHLLHAQHQGRHRYFRIATPQIAHMIESIMQVASGPEVLRVAPVTGPRDVALRTARTCYNHLAGRLGVALADALVREGNVELDCDAGLVTENGIRLFERLGIDTARLASRRGTSARVLCRPCLDWSERRAHLAGAVGSALCARSFEAGWIARVAGTRAVAVTPQGYRVLCETIGVRADALRKPDFA